MHRNGGQSIAKEATSCLPSLHLLSAEGHACGLVEEGHQGVLPNGVRRHQGRQGQGQGAPGHPQGHPTAGQDSHSKQSGLLFHS
eukprot:scaffold240513_cov14-Tisochrysis_lutea.AAC.1